MKLYIGNKNYSSWSLRAWLIAEKYQLNYQEVKLDLGSKVFYERLENVSPTLKVPTLIDDDVVIWESLAICEYINEAYLSGKAWPNSPALRAHARALSSEMHSSFNALRNAMPMNIRAKKQIIRTDEVNKDIRRIEQIFTEQYKRFGSQGGWLFGAWSIADAMFAPVVLRFQTYGVKLSGEANAYVEHVLQCPALKLWCAQALKELEVVECNEVGSLL
ncbi:glutathione S-transferase [Pseudoalteromonas luteoviolacea]|uniref:Glutathione S-transferase n=1 Tax=Pseudoalteromonas luteoviolacea TaxID=43657 RepID=A0A1C0TJJ2_9GAMM|nr:glutathione S-transferase family protein [Pseudoalteromonas luteoviolacea]MBQ4814303.1 glutathione S-transferase family protein [Pseudoalteromonas luteoviolacea]OCQ18447.1 glutathione S-transferase [Pseudoalteromonas luteoviolacea]